MARRKPLWFVYLCGAIASLVGLLAAMLVDLAVGTNDVLWGLLPLGPLGGVGLTHWLLRTGRVSQETSRWDWPRRG